MKSFLTLLAITAFLTILFPSCGNQKEIVNSTHSVRDSIVYIDHIIVDTIKIPSETLEVKVPIEILKRDTIIQFQKGRVFTQLVYRNGSIEVSSRCDSLEKLVLHQDRQLKEYHVENYAKTISQPTKSEHKVPWFYTAALWCWIITVTYFVGKKVFKFYFKKQ